MSTASESSGDRQKAESFFRHGNEAAQKNNFDYAIQMYREACKLAPQNLQYRQALRGIERRKFNNDPSKVGFLAGARISSIRMRARSARGKGHAGQALEICEEAFVHNPWDVSASREGAEAAEQLGYKALAQWFLESVHPQAGEDADYFRHLARVMELNGHFNAAIHCWEKVRKLDPTDEQARRQVNALSASAAIQKSGLHEALHRPPPGEGSAAPDTDDLKRPTLTPEQRLLKEIQDDPSRAGPYLQLADLLKGQGKLDEAEKVLARAIKAIPDDEFVKTEHADVQIARLTKAIDQWSRQAREHPEDANARAKLEKLQTMRDDYELREFRRRVELNPGDPDLHFQLGQRLARAGKHAEAIAEFQQARSSPALKARALYEAGVAFEADGNPKLAERSFQEALKATDPTDVTAVNALNYRLGRVFEAMGQINKAEEHYNEVAANDYTYLDVAQRLRDLHRNASR